MKTFIIRDTGKQQANINMLYALARKYGDISAMDSFASKHITALFASETGDSKEGTFVLENDTNTRIPATKSPPLVVPLPAALLPLPLSRNNSTNAVPSLARNCNSPATFDNLPKLLQPPSRQGNSGKGNAIPPNIHIIRVTQRGLHLLQKHGIGDVGNEKILVDSEADIVPRSAVQVSIHASQNVSITSVIFN